MQYLSKKYCRIVRYTVRQQFKLLYYCNKIGLLRKWIPLEFHMWSSKFTNNCD